MKLANLLTLLRILLIPVFILVFYLPMQEACLSAAFLFAFASVTDGLDGYLARSLKQTSQLGAFLDPVADKLIVVTALVLLVGEKQLPYLTLAALIIICREIAVSALREWMAEIGDRSRVSVSKLAKAKTVAQMTSIILLLLTRAGGQWAGCLLMGYVLFYLAACLSLWSMGIYLKASFQKLRKADLPK